MSYWNILLLGVPGPNPFYPWMVFWCLLAVSALLGLVGVLQEPRVSAAIDRLEQRYNESAETRRSRNGFEQRDFQ